MGAVVVSTICTMFYIKWIGVKTICMMLFIDLFLVMNLATPPLQWWKTIIFSLFFLFWILWC